MLKIRMLKLRIQAPLDKTIVIDAHIYAALKQRKAETGKKKHEFKGVHLNRR